MDKMIRLLAGVNRDAFAFEHTDFGESARIARCGAAEPGHFGWHSAIGTGQWAARRKLCVVVALANAGACQGFVPEVQPDSTVRQAPRQKATAARFPSFALHRVTPVTAGQRWSLTLRAHGPAFR